MPQRLTRETRVPRKTLIAHAVGVSPGQNIQALKDYLHEATLTASASDKLDLVMVDDYDHFVDLVAHHGMPLIQEVVPGLAVPTPRVQSRPGLYGLLAWIRSSRRRDSNP